MAAGPSQATMLVALAADVELFQEEGDDVVFGTVTVDGHAQTWPLKSKGFRRILVARFYAAMGAAPNATAMKDAVDSLEARAATEGIRHPVVLRVAGDDAEIFIDLCNENWEIVKVTPFGWAVVKDSPVRFRRASGMQPLPIPVTGGRIEDLRPFINLTDDDWYLFQVWLLHALRPGIPYNPLALYGEAGACKSSLGRICRSLVDPGKAGLRSAPRNPDDLSIAANNGWLCAFDNLSTLPDWLSDSLCRLSTGAGQGKRMLYFDIDEVLLEARRPVLLSSIEDVVLRGDLLDRSVRLTLPRMPEKKRRQERHFWQRFDAERPRLFGALLTALSQTMAAVSKVTRTEWPRMADFAFWGEAAEIALQWPPRTFTAVYEANIRSAHASNIEGELFGSVLVRMMEDLDTWSGTAGDLLVRLGDLDPEKAKRKDWPDSPRKLSGGLRRLAPSLSKEGIDVTLTREGHDRRRVITLESTRRTPSAPSASSAALTSDGLHADGHSDDTARVPSAVGARTIADDVRTIGTPIPSASKPKKDKAADGADDADGLLQQPSGTEVELWES